MSPFVVPFVHYAHQHKDAQSIHEIVQNWAETVA